jgi:hypothetical protein
MPKVLVVVITKDTVEPAVMQAIKSQDYKDYSILISIMQPVIPDNSGKQKILNVIKHRNFVRKMALECDADYYLWVDSDIVIPPNTISSLVSHGKHFMTGWVPMKGQWPRKPWIPSFIDGKVIMFVDHVYEGLTSVQNAGGCFLISHELLNQLAWRDGTDNLFATNAIGTTVYADDGTQYCLDAAELGYGLFADGDVVCEHIWRDTEGKSVPAAGLAPRQTIGEAIE